MRRRRTWALAMCLAVAYVAALASVAMAQEPPGHVTGLVRDAVNSGTLLDGVLVEALSGTNVVASTSTHSDGFYELPLAVGTYELRFSLADYPTIIIDEVRVVAGQTTVLNVGLTTSPAVFHVSLSLDGIGGEGWLPETKVTITADDPGTLQHPDIERSLTTDAMGVLEGSKMFSAKPGWVFTVTDGVQTKTHVVRDVVITSVDPVTDIVRGTADRSDPSYVTDTVLCNPMAAQGINDQVYYPVPEANGYWQANFSAPYDITPGSEVDVLEIDEDADSTFVLWKVPRPVGWQHDSVSHHDYFFSGERLSWTAAEARAAFYRGHLVTITGAGEQQWLAATFGTEYWIGLKRTAVGSPWVWASSEPVTFTGWLSGEPTDYPSENFAIISNRPPKTPTIGWNNVPADVSMPFVVEVGPATVGELLTVMVVDGALPNAGVANSILKQAQKASLKALTNHLKDLVRRSVITQQTMDQILAMVAG